MDLVQEFKKRQEAGEWVSHETAAAINEIEVLRTALRPFAKEATRWVNYADEEPLVEAFPGYEGELTVGDLRRAFDALAFSTLLGKKV